ncbi:hypothetical protein R70006_04927 [Paraburkholderia domus]|uniref:hypothetical protein n=1 Tax=Paraburkholderia domus TaxID=2793075 RepID=UPI0019116245|nr:hypothetical protein [Paraburkholderia domus]MBK5051834.1 hypothetical protein [Burkholderia sp. R-70006]CAE6792851.1 hypothetical protein R70006_04927 [Paraburkholderia domus]
MGPAGSDCFLAACYEENSDQRGKSALLGTSVLAFLGKPADAVLHGSCQRGYTVHPYRFWFCAIVPHPTEHNPPTIYQLRDHYRRYRSNGVVQRLILEIQHLRGVTREIEALRQVIQRCWNEETGEKLVALERLRSELQNEIFRAGVTDASRSRPLPPFTPPTRHDLLALEHHYADDASIQTLVAELRHARGFILEVEDLRLVILRCWRAETDCDLRALEELRSRLEVEKARAGIIVSATPARRERPGLTDRIALDFDGLPEKPHHT